MAVLGNSEAYREGLKSVTYTNPHPINSVEYNDFERGWSQRVKSGFRCDHVADKTNLKKESTFKKAGTFQEKYKNWK